MLSPFGLDKSFTQFFTKNCGVQRQSLWSPSAEGEKLELNLFNSYRQAHFGKCENGALLGCRRQFCPILHGQKEQTPDWKLVFNLPFFQKVVVSKGNAFGRSSQRAKHLILGSVFWRARDWKLVFNRFFYKKKSSRKPIFCRKQFPKSSQWEVFGSTSLNLAVSRCGLI